MKKYIIYSLILLAGVLAGAQNIRANGEEVKKLEVLPTVHVFERESKTVISGANSQAAGVMWTSQYADYCTAYGDWPTGNISSGSKQPASGGVIIPTDGVSQYAGKFQLTFIMRCTGPGGTSSDYLRLEIDRQLKQPVFISPPDGFRVNKQGGQVALTSQINRLYDIGVGQVVEVSINNGSWQVMNPNGLNFEFNNIQNLPEGTYIYKFRANRNGETSPETTPRSFTVFTPEPPPLPNEEPKIQLPIPSANITVTVKDNVGKSVPGAIVTINPGSSFPASNNATTFPVNPGFPYSVTISGYDTNIYSLSNGSEGRTVRGEVRVDYQVASENNNRNPMNCGTNQERCKQVLNHWMHGDINRTSNPSGFNNFISYDESDDSFTFVFNKAEELQPTLNSLTISPSTVKSNESVTISWTGENLVSCDTALSKNPTNAPTLPLWQGKVPSTSATGGSISLNAPVVSETTTYQFGLSCGENIEARIINNPNNDKSPILTVSPKNDPIIQNPTEPVISIPKIPETKVAPNISGRVYDTKGNGVQAQVIINGRNYNTQSNGTFVISKEIHGLKYAGQFSISTTIPSGYQSSRAVNSRIGPGRGAAYRFQVLGESCTTTEACQKIFQKYGTSGDAVNSRIHDLNTDNNFEFELSVSPTPTEPPIIPIISTTPTIPTVPTVPAMPTITTGSSDTTLPTMEFDVNPKTINYGGSVTITWLSENAVTCIASEDSRWAGVKFTEGEETIDNITSNSRFGLVCKRGDLSSVGKVISVNINPDSVPQNPGQTIITDPGIPVDNSEVPNLLSDDTQGSNSSIPPLPPVLSCSPQGQNVKNIIKGATIDVSDFIGNCTVFNLSYSISRITSDNNKIPVNFKQGSSSQFVPSVSGSYEIMATSVDASGSYTRNITINVFNPDVQEVSP